jgi:transcriptional antiterminator NusG
MTESTAIEEGTGAAANPLRWYVVHAYSGMEKSVQRALQERIERAGMQDQFGQHPGADRRSGRSERRSQSR